MFHEADRLGHSPMIAPIMAKVKPLRVGPGASTKVRFWGVMRTAADQHGEQHDDGRCRDKKVGQRGVDDHAVLSAALAASLSRKPSHMRRTSSVAVEHCSISSNMRLPSLR